MKKLTYKEIESADALRSAITEGNQLRHYAFQNIDFSKVAEAANCNYTDCIFMGCDLSEQMMAHIDPNCYIFPSLPKPYTIFPSQMYSAATLYRGYDPKCEHSFLECYDSRVYAHYIAQGKQAADIGETLARSLHDHSISDSLHAYLKARDPRTIVGVMGGHGIERTAPSYRQIVFLSKRLTEGGSLMISGGGPGAMEATHLGAWMAGRETEEVEDALATLYEAPCFTDDRWLETAMAVRKKYPQLDYESLGMPTWLYGHEPATPFATHIAKYFDNSIREDSIVTIAMGGIVYTPGSAGTMQEIFQEAVQNHYLSFGISSPMIFLGKDYWTNEIPVWPLLQDLVARGKYKNLRLTLTDDQEEVVDVITEFRSSTEPLVP